MRKIKNVRYGQLLKDCRECKAGLKILNFASVCRNREAGNAPLQSLSQTEANFLFAEPPRTSSLTAVSCSGFLDFPATGKLGWTPGTRAARTAWSDCKSAPTCSRPMQKQRKPQRTQETINRFQNLFEYARKSCFLKNLRNDILRAVPLSRRSEYYEYLKEH